MKNILKVTGSQLSLPFSTRVYAGLLEFYEHVPQVPPVEICCPFIIIFYLSLCPETWDNPLQINALPL